jgi:hypothetical protein
VAGADHGQSCTELVLLDTDGIGVSNGSQSCTELVLQGNDGIGVSNGSVETANRHRRKGSRTDEPVIRKNDAANGGKRRRLDGVDRVQHDNALVLPGTDAKRASKTPFKNAAADCSLTTDATPESRTNDGQRSQPGAAKAGPSLTRVESADACGKKKSAWNHANQIRKRKMRRAVSKLTQTAKQKVAGAPTQIRVNSDDAYAAETNTNLPAADQPDLLYPTSMCLQPPVQAVRPSDGSNRTIPMRVVQRSVLVAAQAQARLLAAVQQRSTTAGGPANRAAIARCDVVPASSDALLVADADNLPNDGGMGLNVDVQSLNAVHDGAQCSGNEQ